MSESQQREADVASVSERHIVPTADFVCEEKKDYLETAAKDEQAKVKLPVKIVCGVSIILLVVITVNICYRLFHEQLGEEELEEIVMIEDRFERLKRLKQFNTQNMLSFFQNVFITAIFGALSAFGIYMYFMDTKQHELNKHHDLRNKAKSVFTAHELHMFRQGTTLENQNVEVRKAREKIIKFEENIEDLRRDAINNKDKIRRATKEKKSAEEELAKQQDELTEKERSLRLELEKKLKEKQDEISRLRKKSSWL